jgi:hypothetical protein
MEREPYGTNPTHRPADVNLPGNEPFGRESASGWAGAVFDRVQDLFGDAIIKHCIAKIVYYTLSRR